MEGFQISDFLTALFQNPADFIQPDLFVYHEHCQMVKKVTELILQLQPGSFPHVFL